MNYIFAFSIVILILLILLFLYINYKEKLFNRKLYSYDNHLLELINRKNFFNDIPNQISIKSIDDFQKIYESIKFNHEEWSHLFNGKFSASLNTYSNNRNTYLKYLNNRKLLVDYFLRELQPVINYLSTNKKILKNFSDSYFLRNFYFGYFKPSYIDKHFSEIPSRIKEISEISVLDNEFIEYSKKDNFFKFNEDGSVAVYEESKYVDIINKIKENYNKWQILTSEINKTKSVILESPDNEYIFSRKKLYQALLSSLEDFIITELSNSRVSVEEKFFYNRFSEDGTLGANYSYKSFKDAMNEFFSIRKM